MFYVNKSTELYFLHYLIATNIEIITLGLGDKNEKISIGFPEYTEEISNNEKKKYEEKNCCPSTWGPDSNR